MSETEKISRIFAELAAGKENAGLHPEQARLVALRQMVRDAWSGQIPSSGIRDLIVAEEIRAGSSRATAEKTAEDAISNGKSTFAVRTVGAPRRKRQTPAHDPLAGGANEQLSAWANQNYGP